MIKAIKKLLALVAATLYRPFKRREIWIVGASLGKKYTNNGAIFYKHVLKNYPQIDIYWIINKDAPDLPKAKTGGPFLYRNTIKGNFYTLIADVLVCTHTLPTDVSE